MLPLIYFAGWRGCNNSAQERSGVIMAFVLGFIVLVLFAYIAYRSKYSKLGKILFLLLGLILAALMVVAMGLASFVKSCL